MYASNLGMEVALDLLVMEHTGDSASIVPVWGVATSVRTAVLSLDRFRIVQRENSSHKYGAR